MWLQLHQLRVIKVKKWVIEKTITMKLSKFILQVDNYD